ncbi:MAG: hypothetical protein M1839_007302 [Geoglossum umbratile]|nr:MAG: hypothetical protein M1839_007302 [Geoglossum umbratile]
MALAIGVDQRALHASSKASLNGLKQGRPEKVYPTAKSKAQESIIPWPSIFQSLTGPNSRSDENAILPTIAECAVHLELLQCFHTLRAEVLKSITLDKTFGIVAKPQIIVRKQYYGPAKTIKKKDPTFATRRKEKWPLFLDLAVVRFDRWFFVADSALADPTKENALGLVLPPLDVLMVWHSLLLNPKYFQSYCRRKSLKNMPEVAFPWQAIHEAIDNNKWLYNLPTTSSTWWEQRLNLPSDIFDYLTTTSKQPTVQGILTSYGTKTLTQAKISQSLNTQGLSTDDTAFIRIFSATLANFPDYIQLAAAVERQASFVQKMDAQLWIRSPALCGTLRRAQDRYNKFLKLFKLYPGTMLVPTLDIDLVWHTHQLSPKRYIDATVDIAGRFLDHDDKLGKGTLDEGMEKTKNLFRVRFGKEYAVCNCWDCEALLDAVERRNEGTDNGTASDFKLAAEQVADGVMFYRAVEVARRAGKPLPTRVEK